MSECRVCADARERAKAAAAERQRLVDHHRALSDARDELVRAAVAWTKDDSWANRTALREAADAYEKLAKP